MSFANILASTTPTLDGWEIDSYLGPVVAHVVAGTGFFSDFAAEFSDVFGGRSLSYQRQLTGINAEVIEQLKNKAMLAGGNLILGLRIDHDEISGKGKQMFMVTAYGTAARGSQKNRQSGASVGKTSAVTSEMLDTALMRRDIIMKSKTVPLNLSEGDWSFVTDNQVHEIAPQVLEDVCLIYRKYGKEIPPQHLLDRRLRYFLMLPTELSSPILYDALGTFDVIWPFMFDTISQAGLFNFESVLHLLDSSDFKIQKRGLKVAQYDKAYYVEDDLKSFSMLVGKLKSCFAVRVKFIEDKSLFASTTKAKWVCACGAKNNTDQLTCSGCGMDKFGFKEDEVTPTEVVELLEGKVDVLRGYW